MTTQAVSGRRYFTKAWLMEQKSLIALLVLIAVVSTMSPNFFTVNNLFNILQQTSVNAIMAVGMTLVILTSGIDLSVGSVLAISGIVVFDTVVDPWIGALSDRLTGTRLGRRHSLMFAAILPFTVGIAMVFAAFGKIPPVAGAFLQEGIDVAVILNALRTLTAPKPSR